MHYLAVFRARTQTIIFANLFMSYGAPVSVVNTPRRLNVSCGISAKFPAVFKPQAEQVLARRNFDTFAGFFPEI